MGKSQSCCHRDKGGRKKKPVGKRLENWAKGSCVPSAEPASGNRIKVSVDELVEDINRQYPPPEEEINDEYYTTL